MESKDRDDHLLHHPVCHKEIDDIHELRKHVNQ